MQPHDRVGGLHIGTEFSRICSKSGRVVYEKKTKF